MKIKSIWYYIMLVAFILVAQSAHIRYDRANGTLMQAWFIELPGWGESYSPESTIQLKDWVGSSWSPVTATVNGERNPEVEAGIALRKIGLFSDGYEFEQQGEHWVLRKPAVTTRYFSLTVYYRISPWSEANP